MAVENLTLAPFYGNDRNPYNYAKIEQVTRDISTAWFDITQIREQINLFGDDSQDNYLFGLDLATRMAVEDYLGMSIFPIQYKVYYPNIGTYNTQVYLDLPEVSQPNQNRAGVTINKVEYYGDNSNTVPVTMAASGYSYDPTGNRVILNQIPNTLNQFIVNPIIVTYTTGASPYAQYPVIQQAGLMLLTHLYNNRSTTNVNTLKEIPFGVQALLRPYKPLVM